jgi:hypothetical protein
VSSTKSGDQPEQEALECEQRHVSGAVEQPPVQALRVISTCLQRRHQEERIGNQRDGNMGRRQRLAPIGKAVRVGEGERKERGDGGNREDDGADHRQRREQSRSPGDGRDEPGDHRHGVGEGEVQAFWRRYAAPGQPSVQQQRGGKKPGRRPLARTRGTRAGSVRHAGRPNGPRRERVQGRVGHVE